MEMNGTASDTSLRVFPHSLIEPDSRFPLVAWATNSLCSEPQFPPLW